MARARPCASLDRPLLAPVRESSSAAPSPAQSAALRSLPASTLRARLGSFPAPRTPRPARCAARRLSLRLADTSAAAPERSSRSRAADDPPAAPRGRVVVVEGPCAHADRDGGRRVGVGRSRGEADRRPARSALDPRCATLPIALQRPHDERFDLARRRAASPGYTQKPRTATGSHRTHEQKPPRLLGPRSI